MKNFNTVYTERLQTITNYVSYKVSCNFAVEEIVSDIFIRVSKYLPKFDENQSNLTTWLINIANSSISDYFRKENKHKNVIKISNYVDDGGNEFMQIESPNKASELIESKELNNDIMSALNSLKPNYKEIADMFFIQELQYTEISKILEIPMGTVKGMISRCREKLQSQLADVKESYI